MGSTQNYYYFTLQGITAVPGLLQFKESMPEHDRACQVQALYSAIRRVLFSEEEKNQLWHIDRKFAWRADKGFLNPD